MKLYELVKEAWQNATENGYTLELMSSEAIAEDMCEYDADIQEYPLEDVLVAVNLYRMDNK